MVTYSDFNAGYLDQFPVHPAEARHRSGDGHDELGVQPQSHRHWPVQADEWAPGEYLATVRNENYREEGKPYLDGINFLVVPAEEARTARMIEGDGEVMLWAGDEAEQQIEDAGAAWAASRRASGSCRCGSTSASRSMTTPAPMPPHPILGDVRVREAITMAVNRERINQELLEGRVFDIDSPFAVGWMDCEVEPFTYDPEAAKALLEEAGWRGRGWRWHPRGARGRGRRGRHAAQPDHERLHRLLHAGADRTRRSRKT